MSYTAPILHAKLTQLEQHIWQLQDEVRIKDEDLKRTRELSTKTLDRVAKLEAATDFLWTFMEWYKLTHGTEADNGSSPESNVKA